MKKRGRRGEIKDEGMEKEKKEERNGEERERGSMGNRVEGEK